MPDFDLPSFSLGLDSEPDDDPALPPGCGPDDAADQLAEDSSLEDEPGDEDAPRLFRRLRRGVPGPAKGSKASITISSSPDVGGVDAVDDIEEFSSQEEMCRDDKPSGRLQSVSGSEKGPLCGLYVGSVPSSSRSTMTTEEHPSSIRGKRSVVGKSSVSPLRTFHLIDSDSDSPTRSERADVDDGMFDMSSKVVKGANDQQASESRQRRKGESSRTTGTDDLWGNFSPAKGFRISTPALDKVCEEYYQNNLWKSHAPAIVGNDQWQNLCSTVNQKIESCSEGNCEHPPAYHYFFHENPDIRNLVRRRLPYFSPIGGACGQENKQSAGRLIDYMHQFANGESSGKVSMVEPKTNTNKRSRTCRKATVSQAKECPCPAGWVDPKTSGSIPMNAGKKRVQVTSKSAGHWYTTAGGRKVYATGNRQEMTGRSAYRCFRKENGKGPKKSKRKGNPKKKGKGQHQPGKTRTSELLSTGLPY